MIVSIRVTVEKQVKVADEDNIQDRMNAVSQLLADAAEDLDSAGFTGLIGSSFRIHGNPAPVVFDDDDDDEGDEEEEKSDEAEEGGEAG